MKVICGRSQTSGGLVLESVCMGTTVGLPNPLVPVSFGTGTTLMVRVATLELGTDIRYRSRKNTTKRKISC